MSRRAPVARQAISLAPACPAPVPTTRSGRQPTLSKKQQENAVAQAAKEKAVQNKAYTEAVRSHQRQEEILGFQKIPVRSQDDYAGIESEDEDEAPPTASSTFSAISMPPVIKTTVRNGRTLVHRVEKDNTAVHVPTQSLDDTDIPTSRPNKNLVRRVFRESPKPPQMMEFNNRHGSEDNVMWSDHESESPPTGNQSRTPHPPNKMIRKTPPTSISADTAVVIKKQKTISPAGQSKDSKRRIRVGDFDQLTKSLTEDCIAIYRAHIGAVQPFPVKTDNLQAVQLAWVEVCNNRNLQNDIDDSVFKAVTDRASQIRGQVKTITKTHIFAAYGIDEVNDTQREVRNKIEQLLEGFRFIYKDPAAKAGMYMAPLIQTIINNTWFRDAKDDGVVHPEFSDGGKLSLATLAFVLTVIENCLDEWATGSRKEVQLSQNVYKKKYETHLTRLKDFKNQTAEHGIVPRLLKLLLKNARKHANVDDASAAAKAAKVSEDEIEKAKAEWASIQFSDDESIVDE